MPPGQPDAGRRIAAVPPRALPRTAPAVLAFSLRLECPAVRSFSLRPGRAKVETSPSRRVVQASRLFSCSEKRTS